MAKPIWDLNKDNIEVPSTHVKAIDGYTMATVELHQKCKSDFIPQVLMTRACL